MTTGVLVMAYGTPLDRDDIARFYTDIRQGRSPTSAQLADLRARYEAIGDTFPLRAITDAQAVGLAAALGPAYTVSLGLKHAPPTIEDGVAALTRRGVERIVGLVLAPHYSTDYADRAARAARRVPIHTIAHWHLLPAYLSFLATAVGEARTPGAHIVFTAHSLPAKVAGSYPDRVRETAAAVAKIAGLDDWSVAWQSAGRTADRWLEPDVRDVIRGLAAPAVVVCPCGFTADHLEVLYDLDIGAAAAAAEVGMGFARTRSVNADATVLRALADLVTS